MHVLKIELNDEEVKLLNQYCEAKNISKSVAIKSALFEIMEDECDIKLFNKEYAKHLKDPKTFSLKEAEEILN